ncbi:hypothetical protein [Corynebacterium auris]|uniref:hypothetical protein n=1 Tax=Corynebacterium auris TaxID=44750 RepID=UPI0025B5A0B6|nr:hypothetical protein [Corynebacterium auris]WJY67199.1 hypothetical protein CAURIS_01340 [Corynebacterium auris]
MANSNQTVADIREESFPDYEARIEDSYIEGYDPVSLGAPHSSLHTRKLWVGMGFILAALFGIGLSVWGVGLNLYGNGTQDQIGDTLLILGLAEVAITLVLGFGLLFAGRKGYRQYRERTGRVN